MPPKITQQVVPKTKPTGKRHSIGSNPGSDIETPTRKKPRSDVDLLGSSPAQKVQWENEQAQEEQKLAVELSEEQENEITECIARLQSQITISQGNEEGLQCDLNDLQTLLADNKRLRALLNKLDANKPRSLTVDQLGHLKTQLASLKADYENQVVKEQKDNPSAPSLAKPLPSVMSKTYHYKLPDAKARELFRDLKGAVYTIVGECISKTRAKRALRVKGDDTALPELDYCVLDRIPYVDSQEPNNINALFEGFIWYRLQRYIFNAPLGDWNSRPFRKHSQGGPLPGPGVPTPWSVGPGPALLCYFEEIREPVRQIFPDMLKQLHELRARTFTLLDRLHGDPVWDVQVQAIDDIFGKKLIDFVREQNHNKYLRKALEIVNKALMLDCMMRRSVADWRLEPTKEKRENWRKKTRLFDENSMILAGGGDAGAAASGSSKKKNTLVQEHQNNAVTLIVSPMLLKFGNDNGENYLGMRMIEKARVVTDPAAFSYT